MVAAATGFFDGVHMGHRYVIGEIVEYARRESIPSVIVTFWPHPRIVMQQDAADLRLLTTLEEKKDMIRSLGVDQVDVLNFDKEFASKSAEWFFQFLIEKYGLKFLVFGYDHRVGNDKIQSRKDMIGIARKLGINIMEVPPFRDENGIVISSSKIRSALSSGDIFSANRMLGYEYILDGVVVEGKKIGRKIGFPTANMQLYDPLKMLPADGVYSVRVNVGGNLYGGISNIGNRPTVDNDTHKTIETHILDFDEYIYGFPFSIKFVARMRDIKKFPSMERLKEQLEYDKKRVLEYLE